LKDHPQAPSIQNPSQKFQQNSEQVLFSLRETMLLDTTNIIVGHVPAAPDRLLIYNVRLSNAEER